MCIEVIVCYISVIFRHNVLGNIAFCFRTLQQRVKVMGNHVAAAVVYRSTTKTTRLPNTASIFSAELYAISLALTVIRRSKENNFVIFLDSMSSLQALSGFKLEIHFV